MEPTPGQRVLLHSSTSECLSVSSTAHRVGCLWDSRSSGGTASAFNIAAVQLPHVNQMPNGRQWYGAVVLSSHTHQKCNNLSMYPCDKSFDAEDAPILQSTPRLMSLMCQCDTIRMHPLLRRQRAGAGHGGDGVTRLVLATLNLRAGVRQQHPPPPVLPDARHVERRTSHR